jgi:hypothetical protein
MAARRLRALEITKLRELRAYPDGARFIRVTGCDLSTIPRSRYNAEKGAMEVSRRENFTGAA